MGEVLDKNVRAFQERCRKAGYRATPQRMRICREVFRAEGHPDAERIYGRVRADLPSVSRDTVYRTLGLLEDMGFLSRVSIVSDRARFDARTEQHHHFICTECGAIHDFDSPEADGLKLPAAVGKLGRVKTLRVEVRGICRQCQCEDDSERGTPEAKETV